LLRSLRRAAVPAREASRAARSGARPWAAMEAGAPGLLSAWRRDSRLTRRDATSAGEEDDDDDDDVNDDDEEEEEEEVNDDEEEEDPGPAAPAWVLAL